MALDRLDLIYYISSGTFGIKIGTPDMRDRQSIGVNIGCGRGRRLAKAWTFLVRGYIAGKFYLTVLFSGKKVVEIESRQARR